MDLKIVNLGLVHFKEAYLKQQELFDEVRLAHLEAGLILCQHYPVITLGRSSKKENILLSREELAGRGIEVYEIERGGDVTYHGPGQLMVYPIFNLDFFKKDLHWFLRLLEEWIIAYLKEFDVTGVRISGLTGVWVGDKKIASIGISVKNWISMHGFSINIKKDDLHNFSLIKPCGMDIIMTALELESRKEIVMELAKDALFELIEHKACLRDHI